MSDTSLTRVHYFDRQFLGAQDFEAEQQYHLAMRRRHNIALHTWGIVAGLELTRDESVEGTFSVSPGMAIDGYGRELILQARFDLDTRAFDEKGSDTLDVQIEYQFQASDPRSQRFRGCEDDDAASFYRRQEQPLIRLIKPSPNNLNRREPESVPQGDLGFEPFRAPPDDPQQDWPVFLGQFIRERQKPGQPYTYRVSHADRPYVGLVGAHIQAPSGLARLELGPAGANDTRRFGLFVCDTRPVSGSSPPERLALAIDRTGALAIHEPTIAHGNLIMDGGALEFRAGVVGAGERPWQMYYVDAKAQAGKAVNRELRIEVPRAQECSVVIGGWDPDAKEFKPFLTVGTVKVDDSLEHQVTVHGDLIVQGKLDEPKKRAEPRINQSAQALIFANALTAANAALPVTGLRQAVESDVDVLKRVLTTDGGRTIVGETLEGAGRLAGFARQLVVKPNAAETIIKEVLAAPDQSIQTLVREIRGCARLPEIVAGIVEEPQATEKLRDQLLLEKNKARLEAVQRGVFGDESGRTVTLTALGKVAREKRTAFVSMLLRNSAATEAIIADQVSRDLAAGLLVGPTSGQQAIATALIKLWAGNQQNIVQLKTLIDAIKGESQFRDSLRQALADEPAPEPDPSVG